MIILRKISFIRYFTLILGFNIVYIRGSGITFQRTEQATEQSWVFREIEAFPTTGLFSFIRHKVPLFTWVLGILTDTGKHSPYFTDEETEAQKG